MINTISRFVKFNCSWRNIGYELHRCFSEEAASDFVCLSITQKDLSQGSLRLDNFLMQKHRIPWGLVQKLIRTKKIRLETPGDAASIPKSDLYKYVLNVGDKIYLEKSVVLKSTDKGSKPVKKEAKKEVRVEESKEVKLLKELIIYENSDFLAINKPSGVASQGGAQVSTSLPLLVRAYLASKDNSKEYSEEEKEGGEDVGPRIAQRLDKNTSGAIVVCKTKKFASYYSELLRKRSDIDKRYIGIVEGVPARTLKYLKSSQQFKLAKISNYDIDEPLEFSTYKQAAVLAGRFKDGGKDCMTRAETLGFIKVKKEANGSLSFDYRLMPRFESTGDPKLLREGDDFFDGLRGKESGNDAMVPLYQTIMSFKIWAGRKHQIRAHSALVLKTPILNDSKYGSTHQKKLGLSRFWSERLDFGIEMDEDRLRVDGERQVLEKREQIRQREWSRAAILDDEFQFLHARQLKFAAVEDDKEKKFSVTAALPLHFQIYLHAVFGENYIREIFKAM